MNIDKVDIGEKVSDQEGVVYRVVGKDYIGQPRKPGPLVTLQPVDGGEHRHLNQREFAEFVEVAE